MTGPPLLEVDLRRIVARRQGHAPVTIADDVVFALDPGETLGLVGESGSGKSMLALALMGLLPRGLGAEGRLTFQGVELLGLAEPARTSIRGGRIGMIFQEPMTALNPIMRVGEQIAEGLVRHKGVSRAAARHEALRLMERVRLPEARRRLDAYPHELSGGQRQRVGIAMALAPGPALLLADEPTTALDVTTQAEILDLLADLVAERAMALLLISHDLGVIAAAAGTLLVMYGGTVVERGPTGAVLGTPRHPYTAALLGALPRTGAPPTPGRRLAGIPGTVPRPGNWPAGCRFVTRCGRATAACEVPPPWVSTGATAARCCHVGAVP